MPYSSGYTDYPANQPRPDIPNQVVWLQTHFIQNYGEPIPIAIDKEIKGGLHRVKYLGQLCDYTYDGIFLERRAKGMLVYVEFDNFDTPLRKYYSLKTYPGTSLDQWEEVGSGAVITLNNPKTVPDLEARNALEVSQLTGMVTSNLGNTTVNGQGTKFLTELAVGNEIRIGDIEYYFVASIQNDLSLKTTVGTADHSGTAVPIYKVVVQPGDFVNVIDARTQAEEEADVEPYPASFIWDGFQWLTVYPYGENPYSHVQNTDTGIMVGGIFKTGDEIWAAIIDTKYHKFYNDLPDVDTAANGSGNEAWTSKKIAQELQKRPPIVPDGDPNLFLNMIGQWVAPSGSGGGGGGGGLQPSDFGDSETIDFYYDPIDGKYKSKVIPAGVSIISTSYLELLALRNDGALINGVGYEFEYFTYHLIEYTSEYHTGDPEKIVIFANGLSTFAKRGLSRDYAQDVIEYDIDDNQVLLPGGDFRPGNITYREDTANGLSTYYDFRNYVFRRWANNIPLWDAGATYTSTSWNTYDWPIVQYPGSWYYAFSGEINKPLTSAMDSYHDPNVDNYNNPFWKYVSIPAWSTYIMTNPTSMQLGMSTVLAKSDTYEDFYTFNTSLGKGKSGIMKNIRIGKHTKPNNIVIIAGNNGASIYDNEFGTGSYDSTIGSSYNYNNKFGTNFANNVVFESKNNKIDSNMQNCWFSQEFDGNQIGVQLKRTVGRYWTGNIMYLGISNCMSGSEFSYNLSFGGFNNNAVASRFTGNICSRDFSGNFLGTSANSNLFLSWFQSNTVRKTVAYCTFNQWVLRNYIYGSMYGCTFKATFFDTTVGEDATRYTSTFNFNQFNGDINKSGSVGPTYPNNRNFFASNSNYNTFQNYVKDVGTLAIPYKTNNSIYNFAVEGLTMVTAGLTVNRVIFNQELKPYAVAANLADVFVPAIAAGGGGGLSKVDFIFPEVSLDAFDEVYLDAKITIKSTTKSDNIASIVYYAKEDSGDYNTAGVLADFAAVNAWITANFVAGDRYWIKAVQTRTAGAVNKGYHTLAL